MMRTFVLIGITLPLGGTLAALPAPPLVTLESGTLFGGVDFERAQGCAVGPDGAVYITGSTRSMTLATPGAYDTTPSGTMPAILDGFVAKFTPDLSQRVWCSYIGGDGDDRLYGIQVDPLGFVTLCGWTESANFPTTTGAHDRTLDGIRDFCVSRFSPDGSTLVWSTFVGGAGSDQGRGGMDIDAAGNLWLAGETSSATFPGTAGAFQSTLSGSTDAVLFQLNPAGTSVLRSSYLGGSATETAYSRVRVHADGSVYIAGLTVSADFPTTPASFQPSYGGSAGTLGDAFIARFAPDLGSLVYSTYLGGSGDDSISGNHSLDLDPGGRAIVTGQTDSPDFPTSPGAYRSPPAVGGVDSYVATLSADGSSLVAATLIGGGSHEESSGIAVDAQGYIHVGGNTSSTDYPTTADAHQPAFGGFLDAFYSIFPPDMKSLTYSTYLGGSGAATNGPYERGRDLTLGPGGRVVISGDTNSPSGFPTTAGAWDLTYGGKGDAFVVTMRTNLPEPPPEPTPTPSPDPAPAGTAGGGGSGGGRCGSTGLDLLILPALLSLGRVLRRRRR